MNIIIEKKISGILICMLLTIPVLSAISTVTLTTKELVPAYGNGIHEECEIAGYCPKNCCILWDGICPVGCQVYPSSVNYDSNCEVILEFPKDEGIHPGMKHEWWYFNGHVYDEEGKHYGLIVCFFNHGMLYLGVADEDNGEFYAATIYGDLNASEGKLDISIDENWWVETEKFIYKMHTEYAGTYLYLDMVAEKPPLLIGGQGLVPMGKGGNSYYYSQTRLRINGKLKLIGEEKNISGIGWIDRQWGNWSSSGYDGWEWFSIKLDNNEEIQLFKLFDPETGESITPMLNIMHADNEQETINSFQIEYLDFWIDPESHNKFSHEWRIKIPEKDIELIVTPTIDDQLIHRGLWEGSCTVVGKVGNETVNGWSYTELTHKWSNIEKPRVGYLYIFDQEIMSTIFGNTIILGKIIIETSYDENRTDRVEFYIDGVLKSNDTEYPYEWLWDEFAIGRHEIKVVAYDNEGNNAEDKMGVTIFNLGG